ncbi:MAG: Gfo/Idh/MocA family oxidoreductase [Planctomycetota bacterium]
MNASKLRVSLLGLGRAGSFHLQSLRLLPGVELTAVYDVDREKTQHVADEFECRAAADPAGAIDQPDVDAIIVATPTDSHYQFVELGLRSSKAVFTEKPLGSSLREIDDSFALANEKGLALFVAFQRRFDPSFGALIESAQNGDLGQVQFVRSVSRDNPVPSTDYIRISGGIFHDCMVHDLDMVLQIVGEKPTHLSSFGSSYLPEIGELGDFDNVVATLAFPSGAAASIDISRKGVFGYDQRLEVFGDEGMIQAENQHGTSLTRADAAGFRRDPIDVSFPTRYRDAYVAELACFCRCVRGDEPVPITYADVRTNHLLASGLELAARERRVVTFDEIESATEGS